ncbi:hypothetical protein [Rhodomicrobium sp.]|uniref:hypothetical protein n=1 Tax=Rhodomicrobium sp. TaxID=2720632 RepID=UPI0039E5A49E
MSSECEFRLRAREPLLYAYSALELLDHHDQFDEHREWVLFWVGGVALLRTVGHVLQKVDAVGSPELGCIISSKWAMWKENRQENAIFWDFIEKERNNVLKIFKLGVFVGQVPDHMPSSDECVSNICEKDIPTHCETGEDGRDLFFDAVMWWQEQLAAIEKEWRLSCRTSN